MEKERAATTFFRKELEEKKDPTHNESHTPQHRRESTVTLTPKQKVERCWANLGIARRLVFLLLQLACVLFSGVIFFKFYHGPKMSFIDALYFSVVTSTTVGYGDLYPETGSAKLFSIFYMLIGTVIVGSILGELMDLYVVGVVEKGILDTIIQSTTWVHKSDLDDDGQVSEAEYVLFKLQQMQKVDPDLLNQLSNRFLVLSKGGARLKVGIDVPSKDQVERMKKIKTERDKIKFARDKEVWGIFYFIKKHLFCNDTVRDLSMVHLWDEHRQSLVCEELENCHPDLVRSLSESQA